MKHYTFLRTHSKDQKIKTHLFYVTMFLLEVCELKHLNGFLVLNFLKQTTVCELSTHFERNTVFPLLEAAASNFFDRLVVRLQFEGGYFSRAAYITKNYVKMV